MIASKQTEACGSNGVGQRAANPNRREAFQLVSWVEARGTEKVFIKFSTGPASRPFLNVVAEREAFATRQFAGLAEVVVGSRQDDALVYPFLENPNLEEQIGLHIMQGEKDFALDSVMRYAHFLSGLQQVVCAPSQFCDFLGAEAMEAVLVCLTFGPYDCIPRNLICDSTGWKVVDLEWTFPFPIPMDFLLWRGLHSLVSGLQPVIQAHTGGKAPVLLYQGYGRTRLYLPVAWNDAFGLDHIDLNRFLDWEEHFGQKILKPAPLRRGRLRLSKRNKLYAALPGEKSLLIRYEELLKQTVRFVQTIRCKAPS